MITLESALEILKEDQNLVSAPALESYTFDHLSYDSRSVRPQTLFFAKGSQFNPDYLKDLDLPLYVSETDYQLPQPVLLVKNVKKAMSLIARAFYDFPDKALKILAFTGTKGKTTSAYFAKSILDQMNGGKTALFSTAYTSLDGNHWEKSALTTPESLDLFAMIRRAVDNGMTHLVMEVSSQAYKLDRVYGLIFDLGVFLNISPDHIGPLEHLDFEDYFSCKRQLLNHSRFSIVNSDSDRFGQLAKQVGVSPHLFFGSGSQNKIKASYKNHFETEGLLTDDFNLQLLGRFNQDNAFAAALATHQLGASLENIKIGLANALVPGRMETLTDRRGAKIYIDYAHNGVSLENLISVIEPYHSGRLVLVLGATGNKGESRRQDFGRVIDENPRLEVILTTDDANYEDPHDIAREIQSYVHRPLRFEVDREEAIRLAIQSITGPHDAVILAGKGEDHFQLRNGQREPYIGDRGAVQKYI